MQKAQNLLQNCKKYVTNKNFFLIHLRASSFFLSGSTFFFFIGCRVRQQTLQKDPGTIVQTTGVRKEASTEHEKQIRSEEEEVQKPETEVQIAERSDLARTSLSHQQMQQHVEGTWAGIQRCFQCWHRFHISG